MRPTRITSSGATGFFLRGARGQKVRVVNGVMSPLLNARRADILTAIYSRRLILGICIWVMFLKNVNRIPIHPSTHGRLQFGLIGSRAQWQVVASALSTTYPLHPARMGQVDMWRNTYLSKRCLRHTGLKGGNE